MVYSTKNLSIQDRAVHMKEEKKGLILFFLFLEGGKRNRVLWREGGTFGRIFLNPPPHPGSQVER